jgi:hypothetical protein
MERAIMSRKEPKKYVTQAALAYNLRWLPKKAQPAEGNIRAVDHCMCISK